MNTAEQKRHLGGPESEEKLTDRHRRYLTYHRPGELEMLRIADGGEVVGSIGYWEISREGAMAYETGWEILVAHHGRGFGAEAARALMVRLKSVANYRYVFAFPTPDNPGSNGICRKLGFQLMGVEEAEYPKGVFAPHNVWRLDLRTFAPPRS
jgi:RimJ/RimL family protein N-acetyltransferase